MKRAICTGSFDPVTNGHINIFERAATMVDELIVCVFVNKKKQTFFSAEERVELLRQSTQHIENLKVDYFGGLVPDYMAQHDIKIIVRGLRSLTDFEYEVNEAQMIKHLAPDTDTIFLLTAPELMFVSSSGIRELAKFKGSVKGLVPECVERAILKKLTI
ncbi:MAG: pantetheine-phosphate adenylyltransferase [Selenomonadaceae bacterium]|nr:pantetheine-phosphate adenylyltransferase [Selenomonadaceae bacterium]